MQFDAKQIAAPKYWQQFEDLCLKLFKGEWKSVDTIKNGRSGQPQAGTDVSGTPAAYLDEVWGVQCKGKDALYGASVTARELRAEVEKAKTFKPKLGRWILTTTAMKDAVIEELAREITVAHRQQGLFPVEVLGWEDLQSMIAGQPDVMDEFYPGQGPTQHNILAHLASLHDGKDKMAAMLEQLLAFAASNQASQSLPLHLANPVPIHVSPVNPSDIAVQAQIDAARDLIASNQSATALRVLQRAQDKFWDESSGVARFRLLANRSSALINLGRVEEGLACAKDALRHAPTDPRAIVHSAMAHYQGDDIDTARSMLDDLLPSAPDNDDAVALRILIAADENEREDPFWLVSDRGALAWNVQMAIAKWYRHRGKLDLALTHYRFALASNPANNQIAAELAVTVLEVIFQDERAVYGHQLTAEQKDDFNNAVDSLQTVWDEVRHTEAAPSYLVVAANLCTAYRYREDLDGAERIVDQGLAIDPLDKQMLKDKALLLVGRGGRGADVLAILEKLAVEEPEGVLLKANALATLGKVEEALTTLDDMPADANERMQITAINSRTRLLATTGRQADALDQARALTERFPANPLSFLALSDVFHRMADDDQAREAARRAMELVGADPKTGSFITVIVADALHALADWDACADALATLPSLDADSRSLQLRVDSLLRAGRRQELWGVLSALPANVAKLPEYAQAAAWFHRETGDYAAARRHLDDYLAAVPDDLFMTLVWIDCAERGGDGASVSAFLEGDVERFFVEGSGTRDLMTLAQTLARRGFGARAMALGYKVLRSRWQKPVAHRGYMGLMIMKDASRDAVPGPFEVGPDVAFVVKDDVGRLLTYVVQTEEPQDAVANEISPTSPLAMRAAGKTVGDTLRVHESPLRPIETIVEIKHKYVALYHRSVRHFNEMFPEDTGMISFDVDPARPEAIVERLRPLLSDRASRIEQVAAEYAKGLLPMCFICRNPLEAWAILVGKDAQIDVALGSLEERTEGLARLRGGAKIILDPVASWVAGKIGVLDALRGRFGDIGIASTTLDLLRSQRDNETGGAGRSEGTLWEEDGETRFRPKLRSGSGPRLDACQIVAWFEEHATVLPAIPSADFTPLIRDLGRQAHPSIIDTVFAASGSGYVMIAEDLRLRTILQALPGVRTTWLQAAIIAAFAGGHLDRATYDATCIHLLTLRHHFTSFDDQTMLLAARQASWKTNGPFGVVTRALASPTVEPASSATVIATFLLRLWFAPLSRRTRERLTDTVLVSCRTSNANRVLDIQSRLRGYVAGNHQKSASEGTALRQLLKFVETWIGTSRWRFRPPPAD